MSGGRRSDRENLGIGPKSCGPCKHMGKTTSDNDCRMVREASKNPNRVNMRNLGYHLLCVNRYRISLLCATSILSRYRKGTVFCTQSCTSRRPSPRVNNRYRSSPVYSSSAERRSNIPFVLGDICCNRDTSSRRDSPDPENQQAGTAVANPPSGSTSIYFPWGLVVLSSSERRDDRDQVLVDGTVWRQRASSYRTTQA